MFCSIMKHVERKSVLVKACSRCLYWTIKKVQTLFRCFCFWHQGCQWTAAFITPTRPHPPAPLCCSAATASSPNQAALFTSPLTAFRFPSSLHLRPPTWPPSEARRLTLWLLHLPCGCHKAGWCHFLCSLDLRWSSQDFNRWESFCHFFVKNGEILFHILTCVERCLAVVHPVPYLRLKNKRGVRIQAVSTGCVWLLRFVGIGWITEDASDIMIFACC